MTVNVPGETGEVSGLEVVQQPEPSAPKAAEMKEASEKGPELRLNVAGPCKNPEGKYVGLSKVQRDRLGVEVGGNVELFDVGGKSLGLFMVGSGSKELLSQPEAFTVNGVSSGEAVTVKKAADKQESDMTFDVVHGVEVVPGGLSEDEKKKYEGRLASRASKIAERFPGLDPRAYVVVPSSLAKSMGIEAPKGSTVLPVSKGKVRIGGTEHEIAVVPSGNSIGFTTEAAKSLGIPTQLNQIRVRVIDGVLVIA